MCTYVYMYAHIIPAKEPGKQGVLKCMRGYSTLQHVAACCSMLQCITVQRVLQWVGTMQCSLLQRVALCCSVLHCKNLFVG